MTRHPSVRKPEQQKGAFGNDIALTPTIAQRFSSTKQLTCGASIGTFYPEEATTAAPSAATDCSATLIYDVPFPLLFRLFPFPVPACSTSSKLTQGTVEPVDRIFVRRPIERCHGM